MNHTTAPDFFSLIYHLQIMSELCPSAVRAVTLSGCGGGGAAVTNKTGKKKTSALHFLPLTKTSQFSLRGW